MNEAGNYIIRHGGVNNGVMEQLTGGMHTEQIAETAGKDFENGNKNKEDMINPELVQALGYDYLALSEFGHPECNSVDVQMVQLSSNCSKEGEYRRWNKYLNIMKNVLDFWKWLTI